MRQRFITEQLQADGLPYKDFIIPISFCWGTTERQTSIHGNSYLFTGRWLCTIEDILDFSN